MTLVQIVRIPLEGVATFQRYESLVLPIMATFGVALERRLRSSDGQVEVHVISFATTGDLERYRDSPERAEHLPLLAASGATSELVEVADVA